MAASGATALTLARLLLLVWLRERLGPNDCQVIDNERTRTLVTLFEARVGCMPIQERVP